MRGSSLPVLVLVAGCRQENRDQDAAKWYCKAAAQGNKDARQALEGVEGKLESFRGNGD